jgi:hypothetical protein
MNDISIIFYTANRISDEMMNKNIEVLKESAGDIHIISISQKPMDLGTNVVFESKEQCHLNIYKQLLLGAKLANTKYIATAEDDTFFHSSHFQLRPSDENTFTYNMNKFSYFTWKPDIFSNRGRRTLNALIAPRLKLIEALEERFNLYPDESKIPLCYWAEMSRNVYERHLGVTEQKGEEVYSDVPIVMVNHSKSLNYLKQGTRKRLGDERATSLEYWGDAKNFKKTYLSK